jgi:branched-chain amino acid transport system ATP-binding protein
VLLEIEGLAAGYGRIPVLRGIDLAVAEGELVALVGSNGAGKTTLLRTLSGVQPRSGGTIRFAGQRIDRLSAHARVLLGIAQVPEGRQVFGPLSVEDNLRLGAFRAGRARTEENLERMYALFPVLREKRALVAGALSGGQQQMLALARALMAEPRLLLCDEPSMGLAPLVVEQIFSTLADLRRAGSTILLVEQNAAEALAIADRAYVIETGRIALEGSAAELAEHPRVKEAYLGLQAGLDSGA